MTVLILDANGLVVNAILCDSLEAAPVPAGHAARLQEGAAGIGWRYADGGWIAPASESDPGVEG